MLNHYYVSVEIKSLNRAFWNVYGCQKQNKKKKIEETEKIANTESVA